MVGAPGTNACNLLNCQMFLPPLRRQPSSRSCRQHPPRMLGKAFAFIKEPWKIYEK
jgi:hypothetical protein